MRLGKIPPFPRFRSGFSFEHELVQLSPRLCVRPHLLVPLIVRQGIQQGTQFTAFLERKLIDLGLYFFDFRHATDNRFPRAGRQRP